MFSKGGVKKTKNRQNIFLDSKSKIENGIILSKKNISMEHAQAIARKFTAGNCTPEPTQTVKYTQNTPQ